MHSENIYSYLNNLLILESLFLKQPDNLKYLCSTFNDLFLWFIIVTTFGISSESAI